MPEPCLLVSRDGPVERVTLNRPEVRNAFNDDVIAALSAWAERAARPGGPRVAILGGAEPAFCAGADLAWMAKVAAYSSDENVRDAEAMARMFAALDDLPFPLIGRIHGAALGGGAGLVAVCDVAVAAEDAVFGFTEVKLGIIPAVISPYVLAKIGRSAARELFLTGVRFPARRAREIGLVHHVVNGADLDSAVDDIVRECLGGGPEAIAAAKRLVADVWGRSAGDTLALTSRAIAARRGSAEGQEGLRAFIERRRAAWRED